MEKISTWNSSSCIVHVLLPSRDPLFLLLWCFPSPALSISGNFFLLWHSTSPAFSISRSSSSSNSIFFSKSSFSSFFDLDLLFFFFFFFSFSPYPSSNLLLWNSSLSNSSSMWLNSSMLAVELKFESLNFCHRTWVFNTQDASLQHSFKIVLTNENVPWNHVKLQISPYYIPKN